MTLATKYRLDAMLSKSLQTLFKDEPDYFVESDVTLDGKLRLTYLDKNQKIMVRVMRGEKDASTVSYTDMHGKKLKTVDIQMHIVMTKKWKCIKGLFDIVATRLGVR